ncbi:LCP family protein [Alkaliphilus crotonatoxidans]
MKTFFKIFGIAFLCFVVIFTSLVWSFNHFMRDDHPNSDEIIEAVVDPNQENLVDDVDRDELEELVYNSDRINFVLMGLEGPRSDTLMFVSFEPNDKKIDIISIPRDTYYHRKGYDRLDKRKINSVYGDHGAAGVKTVVSDILYDIPIDYYVSVTYKGAEAIIDSLGGVPVHIPKKMDYYDPYDDPPLRIYFEAGDHILKGADGVKFLRFRKSTPGSGGMSYADGDLGRIKAQQEFIKSAFKKALSLRLPSVATAAFKHVRTDMQLQEVLSLATSAVGMNMENVEMRVLAGEDRYQNKVSYYFPDYPGIRNQLIEVYGGQPVVDGSTDESIEE